MREVWAKFDPESFFGFGFPYAGELSYGWRTGLLNTDELMRVVDGLARRGLPMTREEFEISLLLAADVESAERFAGEMRVNETGDSGSVWQYYVVFAVKEAVADLPARFDLLDSAWADLGYPEEMRRVIYPEVGVPSHLDVQAGSVELARFVDLWQKRLSGRIPEHRILH
ncbi:hypothetical protein Amsp01_012010 [Amycolatopsis sp. NBRC 101858]|uniref:hypothetical protein n=1 Tax=Amycolatopsis sp. NBRC 101858 TaxID=3032200 RepID=UPI0024A25256|nr:hypothetical protein [Amycolatopsis sp. NBRC 101858]GLY35177.1 hypothetical protein Amsp01_012010 [Amycolatopsis sp. NBRC 101858]